MTAAIVAEGLVKTFGGEVRALDGVDLDVPEGTVLGLLGPERRRQDDRRAHPRRRCCGPTPAARSSRASTSLERPDEVRRVIGLSGQYAAVDEYLTGRENLEMFGQLYHLADARRRSSGPTSCSSSSTSTDAADRVVKTYSGGMRRRLDLAAAWSAGRGSSSSTSRPRASTRAAARHVGGHPRARRARARRCC